MPQPAKNTPEKLSLKDRLLAALDDVSWGDLPEAALVEVLIEQLKQTKAALFEAQSAVLKEGMRANDIERSAQEDIRQLRGNPLALAHGDFYFCGINPMDLYVVSIGGRDIRLMERHGRIDYLMERISVEEYARRA